MSMWASWAPTRTAALVDPGARRMRFLQHPCARARPVQGFCLGLMLKWEFSKRGPNITPSPSFWKQPSHALGPSDKDKLLLTGFEILDSFGPRLMQLEPCSGSLCDVVVL